MSMFGACLQARSTTSQREAAAAMCAAQPGSSRLSRSPWTRRTGTSVGEGGGPRVLAGLLERLGQRHPGGGHGAEVPGLPGPVGPGRGLLREAGEVVHEEPEYAFDIGLRPVPVG